MDKQRKRKAFLDNVEKAMYREKQHYVERILAPAVEAVGAGVTYLSYEKVRSTEIVTVNYYGGHTDKINVTGNSLLAILHEVVREIEGHNAHGHICERSESHDRREED